MSILGYMSAEFSGADGATVVAVMAGDRNAFTAIVERYGGRLIAYCRSRTGSEEEADDAAQEVFIRAFSSLASFRLDESFASWLFAIAANHLRSRYRFKARDDEVEKAARFLAASSAEADPHIEIERSFQTMAVRDAVASLPEHFRRPVELYYFAELSVAETASALGLGEEGVKSRLFRARALIRRFFEMKEKASRRGVRI